jgi:hypothetical protein
METPHFLVYFDKEKHTAVAKNIAKIAEECYGPITKRLDHEPETKTHIIILDTDDCEDVWPWLEMAVVF